MENLAPAVTFEVILMKYRGMGSILDCFEKWPISMSEDLPPSFTFSVTLRKQTWNF